MRACGQESRTPTRVQDGKRQRQPIAGKEHYTKEFSWFGNYGVTPIKSFQMVNMAEFCNARQRPCELKKNNCLSYSMSFALQRHWWFKDDAGRSGLVIPTYLLLVSPCFPASFETDLTLARRKSLRPRLLYRRYISSEIRTNLMPIKITMVLKQ